MASNPQFENIRQMIQGNPQLLQVLLQQIATQNPQLFAAINQNPEEFMRLLAGGPGGAGGGAGRAPPGSTVINITLEEKEAIDRVELA